MLRNPRVVVLAITGSVIAGCTQPDFKISRPDLAKWPPVTDAKIASAPEAKPPKVLPETHLAAARLFESRGMLDRAITQYRRAIAVNHSLTEAYHRLGLLLSIQGRREEAQATLRRAVKLEPDNAILRNNLGFELLLAQRWEESARELKRAIALRPGFTRAHVNLGMAQSRLGRFDQALASFKKVLPEADAYYNLGLMYRGQHRYVEAAGAFNRARAINPDFGAARTQLTQIGLQLAPTSSSDATMEKASVGTMQEEPTAGPIPEPFDELTWTAEAPSKSMESPPRLQPTPQMTVTTESPQTAITANWRPTETIDTAAVTPVWSDADEGIDEGEIEHVGEIEIAAPDEGRDDFLTIDTVSATFAQGEPMGPPALDEGITATATVAVIESFADEALINYAGIVDGFCAADPADELGLELGLTCRAGDVPALCEADATQPAAIVQQLDAVVSTVDPAALLRQLEAKLAVVRDEIECLDSQDAETTAIAELVKEFVTQMEGRIVDVGPGPVFPTRLIGQVGPPGSFAPAPDRVSWRSSRAKRRAAKARLVAETEIIEPTPTRGTHGRRVKPLPD